MYINIQFQYDIVSMVKQFVCVCVCVHGVGGFYSCCSSFLDEKTFISYVPIRDVQQRRPLFTDVSVTLVAYRHDIKRGSSTPWLFQDLR